MFKKLLCKILDHKYGDLYEFDKHYMAKKCSRCDDVVKQDKQTIREVMFGIFDEDF